MCEVWKWIAVGTGAPLVALVFWLLPSAIRAWTVTRGYPMSVWGKDKQLLRYQRILLLDAAVCFVAVVISLAHCV
jgi:hypothetical protein